MMSCKRVIILWREINCEVQWLNEQEFEGNENVSKTTVYCTLGKVGYCKLGYSRVL